MPRGGKRPGAGRPRGARGKVTVLKTEILPHLEASDQPLPLYGLLQRIADETLDPRYRDLLRIATLPYLHAKVPATLTAKPVFMMSDDELKEVSGAQREHEKQVALGRGHLHVVDKRKKG